MRLYHHPLSSNSRRAALAAAHLGLPAELIKIDLERGEQRSPEFLALNPNGMVPVLEDNGFILTESHAIMLYLADKARGHAAYPEDARARADINRWVFWNAQHFQPTVSIFVWENLIKGMIGQGAADPAQLRRGEDLLERYAPVLDEHLSSQALGVRGQRDTRGSRPRCDVAGGGSGERAPGSLWASAGVVCPSAGARGVEGDGELDFEELTERLELRVVAGHCPGDALVELGGSEVDLAACLQRDELRDLLHLGNPTVGLRQHVGDLAAECSQQRRLALGKRLPQLLRSARPSGRQCHGGGDGNDSLVDAGEGHLEGGGSADGSIEDPDVEAALREHRNLARMRAGGVDGGLGGAPAWGWADDAGVHERGSSGLDHRGNLPGGRWADGIAIHEYGLLSGGPKRRCHELCERQSGGGWDDGKQELRTDQLRRGDGTHSC